MVILNEQIDLAEQVLAAVEKRYQRQRNVLVTLVLLLLLSTIYFANDYFREPAKIVPMSQQQAETTAGVRLAADTASALLKNSQVEEIAGTIKKTREREAPPDKVITIKDVNVQTGVAQLVDKSKADLTIITPPVNYSTGTLSNDQKASFNVYNIRAYPKAMFGISVGKTGSDISYLRRIDITKVPFLLPKGGVGYSGPYIRAENGRCGLDYGIRVMIPL